MTNTATQFREHEQKRKQQFPILNVGLSSSGLG